MSRKKDKKYWYERRCHLWVDDEFKKNLKKLSAELDKPMTKLTSEIDYKKLKSIFDKKKEKQNAKKKFRFKL